MTGPFPGVRGLAIQWAMLIGYARVSTDNQETAAQVAALKSAGCERIYREKASGGRWDRPALQEILARVREGDVLVVWKIDRLSRSLRDLLTIMERLGDADARFRSLTEAVDTTTPAGRMMLHIAGSFAEYERAMLHERTRSGLELARQDGRIGGRRPKLTSVQQQKLVRLVSQGTKTAAEAARLFDVHPATASRLLTRARARCT
jgi:DNA invertase Pin-like site-specific DNA recombinase